MSEVKVNKISPRSGTTVTLGDSGDTFTIPSGATINNQGTATNFGATGSASWVTTVKTSSPFTAVAGEGYFINTTGGAVTVNLPAGTPGAVVAIKDYAGTFDTNKVLLVQNGSDKIGGSTVNASLDVEGIAVTLVFIDSTQGWLVTDSGLQDEAPTAAYVTATGGTITTSGNFKIHTFTGPGAFCVSSAGNAAGSNTVDYLVVAGGAGGGGSPSSSLSWGAGGGGAGGFRESPGTASGSYTVSPLGASPAVSLSVPATSYPITVGAGGAGGSAGPAATLTGVKGVNSTFSTITSAGGGGGSAGDTNPFGIAPTKAGGSGGGMAGGTSACTAGIGNTPPVNPPQGQNGGTISDVPGGDRKSSGGGGATQVGQQAPSCNKGGAGGAGGTTSISATPTAYAGGGGGGGYSGTAGAGGTGGGGAGGAGPNSAATAGTANTGGGGGGASSSGATSAGGSGIVIIRYKFQN